MRLLEWTLARYSEISHRLWLSSLCSCLNSQLGQKNSDSKKIVIIIVVVGFVIISVCTYISWKWIAKRRAKKKTLELANAGTSGPVDISVQDALSGINLDDLPVLPFEVWNFWKEDKVDALIDPRISSLSYRAEVMRCIHIGLLCVQELPKDRPSVSVVLSMLSRDIENLPEPKQSAYSLNSNSSQKGTSTSSQSQKSSSSMNYVSLTTVDRH
ncbi:hypothetical protein ACS0TY_031184 [Phlomoides rotata]